MSTFRGSFDEDVFKDIVVDRFDRDLSCEKAFFLSHYHTDHMRGLHDAGFVRLLRHNPTTYLYCSTITKNLLLKDSSGTDFRIPKEQILELSTEEIYLNLNGVTVKVTPLRAGHCPGSLMFMFEACDTKILYTGDFRYNELDLKRCSHYVDDRQFFSNINSLYLDTTFATPDYESFPSREESYANIRKIIRTNWSDFDYFVIYQPARIGQEVMIPWLYKDFEVKIHLSCRNLQRTLSCIEHLKYFVTDVLNHSKIHICGNISKSCSEEGEDCPRTRTNIKYLSILPTALKFKGDLTNERSTCYFDGMNWRVAYSSHSSLKEIAEFVKFIKPNRIKPCALQDLTSEEEVIEHIQSYIRRRL